MSGPVSENGVFLNDNVRIRKALEEERRILRLQQVRQESKNLSRKLRNEVTAEKERQIRKLQAIKEKEQELWRHAVLKQKYGDYREAIYHIGDAHKNARAENDARQAAIEANKCQTKESLFHKQMRVRQSYGKYKPPPPPPQPSKRSNNKKKFKRKCFTTKKQLHTTANNTRQRAGTTLKRKRHCCCHHQNDCGIQYECLESHDEYDNDYVDDEVYSCCLSPTSNASDAERDNLDTPERQKLKKTTPVLLEVEEGFNFGAKQTRSEMKDKFVKENRQFTHVVHGSPEKRLKSTTKAARAVASTKVDEKKDKKPAEKLQVEPVKLPRLNKVTKLIEKLDAERESNRAQMNTRSAEAEVIPTETESETYNTLTTITTTKATAQQPISSTTTSTAGKEQKRPVAKAITHKIIRAPLAAPSTSAAARTLQKPATKAIASKAAVNNSRGRINQRASAAVAVRKVKPRSSHQPAAVVDDDDDVDYEDANDMQPSGSPAKILREKSPTSLHRSPQRISIHSTAGGSISITVDRPGPDVAAAEYMETTVERLLPASQQPPSEPRILESRYDIMQREREQACRELKTLSDKLATLARDCTSPTPSKDIIDNGGSTYRVAATGAAEKQQTLSTVSQPTKVDRASSPTLPVSTSEIEKTTATATTTTTTTTLATTTSTQTKEPASATVPTFKKPYPLPRVNYRESVTDKGTKTPTKVQTTPTKATKAATKTTASPTKITASPTKTTASRTKTSSSPTKISGSPTKVSTTTTTRHNNSNISSKRRDTSLTNSSYSFVMLDYVADQSQLLRTDLNEELKSNAPNRNKCEKLQALLERNEKLGKELTEKLGGRSNKRQETANNNKDEIKTLISAVCEVRKEREEILNAEILNTAYTPSPQAIKTTATTTTRTITTSTAAVAATATPVLEQENILKKRELELQGKEEALTKKLCELKQQQKQFLQKLQQSEQKQVTMENTHTLKAVLQQEHAVEDEPVEIVITVKGAKPVRKSAYANNMENLTTNHVLKITSANATEVEAAEAAKRKPLAHQSTPCPASSSQKNQQQQQITNSTSDNTYDSTSTQYRSLPKKLHVTAENVAANDNDDDTTLKNIVTPNDEIACPCPQGKTAEESARNAIHPIVAQYVDRLLNMRRSSVRALGVSMSDMETPPESLVNITTNETRIADELRDKTAQVTRVERFIEDNYTFIQNLEQTLISQQNISLDKSMLMVEELWKQHFKKSKTKKHEQKEETKSTEKQQQQQQKPEETAKNIVEKTHKKKTHEHRVNESISEAIVKLAEANKIDTSKKCKEAKVKTDMTRDVRTKTPEKNKISERRIPITMPTSPTKTPIGNVRKSYEKPSTSKTVKVSAATTTTTTTTAAAVTATITKKTKPNKPIVATFDGDDSRNHFSELANSCSQRIIELNSMLERVREEKQRLLESTYSSVSLGSAEVVAPPPTRASSMQQVADNKRKTPQKVPPKTPEKKKKNQQHIQEEKAEEEETTTSSSMRPLPDRNAAIAGSRDSGIGGSRPVTRQEQLPPQAPPPTAAAATLEGEEEEEESTAKHGKPPATLRRYSPQLNDVEAATAHELSTIVEVETPITSRLNTQADEEEQEDRQSARVHPKPVPFPAFEQYLQALQLDLTRIDPELSFQLAEQYDGLVKTLEARDSQGLPRYAAFPSISGYLQNITQMETIATEEPSRHHIDESRVAELINCLRLANMTVRTFPSQREYATQHLCTNSPASDMLDTATLENLSGITDTDSDTLNIEQELEKRHLLPYAFNSDSKHEDLDISITTKRTTPSSSRKCPNNTKHSSLLQEPFESMGTGNWAATMRRRIQETNALSSETSTSPEVKVTTTDMFVMAAKKHYLKNRSTTDSAGDDTMGSFGGRRMNLRDFLHREITRYSHSTTGTSSSNTTSSDYSLRQNFFQSILDSMTPQTQPSGGAAPEGSKNTVLSSTPTDNISNGFKTGTQSNLTRLKTSTPVPANSTKSTNTPQSQGSMASTLFSCESHISQVAAIHDNKNQEYDKTKRKKKR